MNHKQIRLLLLTVAIVLLVILYEGHVQTMKITEALDQLNQGVDEVGNAVRTAVAKVRPEGELSEEDATKVGAISAKLAEIRDIAASVG